MPVTISPEQPDSADARALIAELDAYLIPLYPPASHHGYPVEKLISEGVDFFLARVDETAAGCGAVKFFPAGYAELKRMYVRRAFRGRGLGKIIIEYLETFILQKGIRTVRLETGVLQAEAIGLYERMGYKRIEPFGEYLPDPLSYFYEKRLPHVPSPNPEGALPY